MIKSTGSLWAASRNSFITGIFRALRIGVEEGCETVSACSVPHDVVVSGAFEGIHSQIRSDPVNPVFTFRITGHFPVCGFLLVCVKMGSSIVHAEHGSILKQCVIGTGISFPGSVGMIDHFFSVRTLAHLLNITTQGINKKSVREEFSL